MKLRYVILLICLLFIAVSCGKKSAEQNDLSFNDQTLIKIMLINESSTKPLTEKNISELNDAFPEYNFEIEWAERDDYYSVLSESIDNNDIPDVFMTDTEFFGKLIDNNALSALTSFSPETESFFSRLIDGFSYNQELYALPLRWDSYVLYYNMDYLNENGMEYPSKDWDWDDFEVAVNFLSVDDNEDGTNDRPSFSFDASANCFYNWIRQNGGRLFNSKNEWVMSIQEYKLYNTETLEYLSDFIFDSFSAYPLDKYLKDTPADMFFEGEIPLYVGTRGDYFYFREIINFNWGYSVLPYKENRAALITAEGLAISSDCSNQDVAYIILTNLVSAELQNDVAIYEHMIPADINACNSELFLKTGYYDNYEDDPFFIQLDYGFFHPQTQDWLKIKPVIESNLNLVFSGETEASNSIIKIETFVQSMAD